ncbi:MAG: phosphatase PAP2 family protein [Acidimicrobiia bacterium]
MISDGRDPDGVSRTITRAVEPELDTRRLAIVAAVCGAGFVAVALLVVTGATGPADTWWHGSAASLRNPPFVWTAQAFTVVGDVPLNTAFRVAGAVWLLWRRRFTSFWAWLLAATLSPILVDWVVKPLVGRTRPLDFVWTANGMAFPSGHAAAAATNAAIVVLLLVPARHRRAGAVAGAVWIVAMSLARTLLGAHWLSDVVGGILLGLSVTFAVVAAVFAMRAHHDRKEVGTWDARSP